MTHTLLFGLQIAQVVGIGFHLDGYVLYDFQSVGFQSHTLYGIVGEQAHLGDAELAQYLCATAVVALVRLEAEVHVGLD